MATAINKRKLDINPDVNVNTLRKHLAFIRCKWYENSETTPFCFSNLLLGNNKTFEQFCFEFLNSKTTKRKTKKIKFDSSIQ